MRYKRATQKLRDAGITVISIYKRADLILLLQNLKKSADTESAHAEADQALIDFIADPKIARAYGAIPKRYA